MNLERSENYAKLGCGIEQYVLGYMEALWHDVAPFRDSPLFHCVLLA